MKKYKPRKRYGFPENFHLENEAWKISMTGRYSVSNLGRCFSHLSGRLIGTKPNGAGYSIVPTGDGTKSEYVHRAIWERFVSLIPEGMHINHIDGNKMNNHLDNLEVVTASQNAIHARRVLKVACRAGGNPNFHNRKVTDQTVMEIRKMAEAGVITRQIAELVGLHPSSVRRIVTRRSWA